MLAVVETLEMQIALAAHSEVAVRNMDGVELLLLIARSRMDVRVVADL